MTVREDVQALMANVYGAERAEHEMIARLPFEPGDWERCGRLAFVLFTWDLMYLRQVRFAVDQVLARGEFAHIRLLPEVPEPTLIDLYKYHYPQPAWNTSSARGAGLRGGVPSVGWPAVRRRFEKPVIACLIEGSLPNFYGAMLEVKGPMRNGVASATQVRSRALNEVLNLMHSADDHYAVVREGVLFFGEETFARVATRCESDRPAVHRKNRRLMEMAEALDAEGSARTMTALRARIQFRALWRILAETEPCPWCEQALKELERLSSESTPGGYLSELVHAHPSMPESDTWLWIDRHANRDRFDLPISSLERLMSAMTRRALLMGDWETLMFSSAAICEAYPE